MIQPRMQCILANFNIVIAILAAILYFALMGLKNHFSFKTLIKLISVNNINK